MKRIRLFYSAIALIFGLLVVFISLVSTNQVVSFEGSQVSNLKFYLGETILPDHVVYPVIAAADRVVLVLAPPQEKIKLQVAYAQIRMDYALGLLFKEEFVLAAHALTKSQKYISLATLQVLADDFDNSVLKQEVAQELEKNIELSRQIAQQLAPCQRTLVDQLNQNNLVLLEKFN